MEQEREYIVKLQDNRKFEKPLPLPNTFYKEIVSRGKARFSQGNHFYAGGYFKTAHGNYIVIVAAEDPYGFKELEELKRVLLIVFVIAIILTYISGRVFSFYTVKPVRGIIQRVQNITANNLHLRLPETRGKDELAEMVHTFNDMLNRLETAFETQNNFVSNASHELRTPLTILTSETELLQSIAGLPENAQESAKAILSQAEKLEHILSSLLGLAQSGFNGKKQNWEIIRIDELVLHVVAAVKKIEPEGTIDLNFDELPDDENLLQTSGNVNLLQLALSNIVLNACKYSNNSPVEVKVSVENSRIVIGVTDKGIGIPEEEQQHIFEPFFRASNTTDFEGHGIGLPLTLNIIRLHKGTIGIRSEEEIGTEIQILLPIHSN